MYQDTIHPEISSPDERKALFDKCFSQSYYANLAAGWFYSSPIHNVKRDNIVEWLLWALFYTRPADQPSEWEEEINDYVSRMEGLIGHTFEPGRNDGVTSMRLTLDPVPSLHRPLLWYSVRRDLCGGCSKLTSSVRLWVWWTPILLVACIVMASGTSLWKTGSLFSLFDQPRFSRRPPLHLEFRIGTVRTEAQQRNPYCCFMA